MERFSSVIELKKESKESYLAFLGGPDEFSGRMIPLRHDDTIEHLYNEIRREKVGSGKTFDELLIDTDAGDPAKRALAFKEKCPQCGRTPPVGFSWNEETKKVDLRCSEGHEWPTEHLDHTIFDVPHPSDPDFKCSKCGRNAWGSHICEG